MTRRGSSPGAIDVDRLVETQRYELTMKRNWPNWSSNAAWWRPRSNGVGRRWSRRTARCASWKSSARNRPRSSAKKKNAPTSNVSTKSPSERACLRRLSDGTLAELADRAHLGGERGDPRQRRAPGRLRRRNGEARPPEAVVYPGRGPRPRAEAGKEGRPAGKERSQGRADRLRAGARCAGDEGPQSRTARAGAAQLARSNAIRPEPVHHRPRRVREDASGVRRSIGRNREARPRAAGRKSAAC